jgi:GNAT superfamily N-acetyltransferase
MTTTEIAGMIQVRRAVPADIGHLVEFNLAMARETEAKALVPAALRAGVARVLAEPVRGFYLVAECDGAVAGCLMITYEWSDWRNGDWWWLQSVYVAPAFRRRGCYSALHAEVERAARATAGVVGLRLYVERENHHAQATYAALGLHEAGYAMWEREFA